MKEWVYWSWPERRTVRFVPNSGQVPFIIIWFTWRIFLWSQFVLTGSSGGRQRAMLNISVSYAAPQNSTQEKTSSETQGQSVGSGETARRKFFFIWKIKPWILIMITINFKIKRCHYLNSVFTAVVIFVAEGVYHETTSLIVIWPTGGGVPLREGVTANLQGEHARVN